MRKLFLILALALLFTVSVRAEDIKALFDEANKLMDGSKYKEALTVLEKAEKKAPKDINVYRYKGYCLMMMKKFEDSIAAYDECLKIDPKYAKALYNQAACLISLSKFEESLKKLNSLIALKDKNFNAPAYSLKISCLLKEGKDKEAKTVMLDLIKIDPATGYDAAGNYYYSKKDYSHGAEAYIKACAANPKNLLAYYNGACCQSLSGNIKKSCEMLEKALKLDAELKKSKGDNYHLAEQMVKDPDLSDLRKTKEYKALAAKYK